MAMRAQEIATYQCYASVKGVFCLGEELSGPSVAGSLSRATSRRRQPNIDFLVVFRSASLPGQVEHSLAAESIRQTGRA